MDIAALVVAVLALVVAYVALRHAGAIEGRLTQSEADLQHAKDRMDRKPHAGWKPVCRKCPWTYAGTRAG